MANILTHFSGTAKKYPDKIAVTHHVGRKKNHSITFKDLDQKSDLVAEYILGSSAVSGAFVGIYMHKTIEHIITILGILKAGAAYYSINSRLKLPQVEYIVKLSKSKFLFIDNTTLLTFNCPENLKDTSAQFIHYTSEKMTPIHAHIFNRLQQAANTCQFQTLSEPNARHDLPGITNNDIALALFTSGSTGSPKGVMISHQDLYNRVLTECDDFQITANDCLLSLLPFSFDVGCNQLFTALIMGARLVILNSWLPQDISDAVHEHNVTGISGVPVIWSSFLDIEDNQTKKNLNTLRYITVSGGDLPITQLKQLKKLIQSPGIFKTYGQTETFRSGILKPHEFENKHGSVGKPVEGTEVFILNKRKEKARSNEIGEIIHRGCGMMAGYLGDMAATRKKIKPNPLKPKSSPSPQYAVFTGDIGRIDEDGYLYILGRQDKMIKTSGYRVYPKEITDQILTHPAVKDAVVFAVKDDKIGSSIVCELQTKHNTIASEVDIKAYLASRLPAYMIPAKIIFVDTFHRTPSGKIKLAEIEARHNVEI